jgi:uncharacterized protein (TIGR02246 family)
MTDTEDTVERVLDGWQGAIARGEPELVAGYFTHDALFQGLRPTHSVGRQGVADYYAAQRPGLTADYRILRSRRLSEDAILSYQRVDFAAMGEVVARTHLTVVLTRSGESWLISHYHVSRV